MSDPNQLRGLDPMAQLTEILKGADARDREAKKGRRLTAEEIEQIGLEAVRRAILPEERQ